MSYDAFLPYLAVMAVTTYLTRMLPLTVFRRRIKSPFIRSFLWYVPYAVLAAMTLPGILYSTGSMPTAAAGLLVAALLSWMEKPLLTVAMCASLAAFIAQWIVGGGA
jgi:branched-subunit amino acid transport protein